MGVPRRSVEIQAFFSSVNNEVFLWVQALLKHRGENRGEKKWRGIWGGSISPQTKDTLIPHHTSRLWNNASCTHQVQAYELSQISSPREPRGNRCIIDVVIDLLKAVLVPTASKIVGAVGMIRARNTNNTGPIPSLPHEVLHISSLHALEPVFSVEPVLNNIQLEIYPNQ
jgi:hypothetical protein